MISKLIVNSYPECETPKTLELSAKIDEIVEVLNNMNEPKRDRKIKSNKEPGIPEPTETVFPSKYAILTRHDSDPGGSPQHFMDLTMFTTSDHDDELIDELVQAWNDNGIRDCIFTYVRTQ